MEFILADQDRMELGILSAAASLDIDLSRDAENSEGTNDGQMTVTDRLLRRFFHRSGHSYG